MDTYSKCFKRDAELFRMLANFHLCFIMCRAVQKSEENSHESKGDELMDENARPEACLKMCADCNLHGRIVFSNGSKSKEIWYQEQGIAELRKAWRAGLLKRFEVNELVKRVYDHLPSQKLADSIKVLWELWELFSSKVKPSKIYKHPAHRTIAHTAKQMAHPSAAVIQDPVRLNEKRTHPICNN